MEQLEYFKWKAGIYRDRIVTLSRDMEALKEELEVLRNAACKVTGEPQLNFLRRETEICGNKVAYRSEKIVELNKELEVVENIINEIGQLQEPPQNQCCAK